MKMTSIDQRKSQYIFEKAFKYMWLILCRLPMKDGLLDWDCADSLNIPDMEKALSHIRTQGTFPVSESQRGIVFLAGIYREEKTASIIHHPGHTKHLVNQRPPSLSSHV